VITKVGNATLMTNVTTASGFATFTITQSRLLIEFGVVASLSILAIFIICLLIIPISYSFLPKPKPRHLEHLNRKWTSYVIGWMTHNVKERRWVIYTASTFAVILGAVGIYQMRISGSLLEDMPKNAPFYQDIRFFENEFDGIMPIEIIIDTKQDKGVTKRSTIIKMAQLEDYLNDIPQLSRPVSIVSMVKYAKQAFYNGDPRYYDLPTAQENNFIMSYLKKGSDQVDFLKSFVSPNGRMARISVFIKDEGIDQLDDIEIDIRNQLEHIFPSERFEVTITGKAYMFEKGTKYLVRNLLISLSLAIVLISLFIAYMFRSFRMILISVIPNLIPLIITAGLMGYLGVPIKPSTVLVFSIAFGISVDDTIHFLAKYRQELQSHNWKIKRSVFAALKETGISMLYTSVVLFFGFSVFLTSDFGGTVALGALISGTLLVAMLSNLMLLPSMLLTLEKLIANKTVLKEPTLKIIPDEEESSNS
jgi:predicted RND superfamily exporter protein